jgi:hypothetical protein
MSSCFILCLRGIFLLILQIYVSQKLLQILVLFFCIFLTSSPDDVFIGLNDVANFGKNVIFYNKNGDIIGINEKLTSNCTVTPLTVRKALHHNVRIASMFNADITPCTMLSAILSQAPSISRSSTDL